MLDLVKKWLRLRTDQDAFDDELTGLIDACKIDLQRRGVVNNDDQNALVQQAIKLYCKAYFGFSNDAERYAAAYDKLADSLALCGDFNTAKEAQE